MKHVLLLAIVGLLVIARMDAQVIVPVHNGYKGSRIQVGASIGTFHPDWGKKSIGGAQYADVSLYRRYLSAEERITYNANNEISELTFGFGPMFTYKLHWLTPFATAQLGIAHIGFKNPIAKGYSGESFMFYSYGVGVEKVLTRHFSARVEGERQTWRGDSTTKNPYLTPTAITIGGAYRF